MSYLQTAVPPLPPTRHLVCLFYLRASPHGSYPRQPPPRAELGRETTGRFAIFSTECTLPYPACNPSVSKLGPPVPATPCFRLGAREESAVVVWGAQPGESTGYEVADHPFFSPHLHLEKGPGGPHGVRGTGRARPLLTPDFLMVAAGFLGGPGFPNLLGRSGGRLGKGERRERWGCGRV